MGRKISNLCKNIGKDAVLMIDEVDKCSDNQIFLNFLGLLRSKYLDMQEGLDISFRSVILAGGYNIKNLKLKLRSETERKYNSPWNIRNVENAEKELLNNDNTLFDDMIKNIENNKELKQIVTNILLEGKKLLCVKSDPAINMGMMFGILSDKENMVCISNIIFETYLYNHVIAGKVRVQYTFAYENNQFTENGVLDMERVLQKFQELMKVEYRSEDTSFMERQGRLLFLCFIKPIINGKGNYYVEPETRDNTRMDVVISYGGREYIVELKIYRGQKYRQKGLEQLEKYLDSRNSQKGYLVSFNFNKEKTYMQNTVCAQYGRNLIGESP